MIVFVETRDPYAGSLAEEGYEPMLCLGGVCDGRVLRNRPDMTPRFLFECQRVDLETMKCLPALLVSSTRYIVRPLHVTFVDEWRGGTTDPENGAWMNNILLATGLEPLEAIARLVSNYPEANLIGGTP